MLDLDELKNSMTPEQISKVDLAMSRLKTLTPDARSQILVGVEAMVECEVTKRNLMALKNEVNKKVNTQNSTNEYDLDYDLTKLKYIESMLIERYVKLKEVSDITFDVNDRDTVCKSVERVLKLGTYSQGASAIIITADIASLWLQKQLLEYHIKNYHNFNIDEEM